MNITSVRVDPVDGDPVLKAFASFVIDEGFVVRDVKVLEGPQGLFVGMPSRKIMTRCKCGQKNVMQARYCNACGIELPYLPTDRNNVDVAHPLNQEVRAIVEKAVIDEYNKVVNPVVELGKE